jgi:hypothetical protein
VAKKKTIKKKSKKKPTKRTKKSVKFDKTLIWAAVIGGIIAFALIYFDVF